MKLAINANSCDCLQDYLSKSSDLASDVIFDKNKTKIVASRFVVQLANLQTFDDFGKAMRFLWKVCDFYSDKFDVRVYHPVFKWSEQVDDQLLPAETAVQ